MCTAARVSTADNTSSATYTVADVALRRVDILSDTDLMWNVPRGASWLQRRS